MAHNGYEPVVMMSQTPQTDYSDSPLQHPVPQFYQQPESSSFLIDQQQSQRPHSTYNAVPQNFYPTQRRRGGWWSNASFGVRALVILVVLVLVAAAVVIPVYFAVIRPNSDNSSSSSSGSSSGGSSSGNSKGTGAITGADGSTVTTSDGSTFTYSNKFGGFWVDDPNDPLNNNAQPNSWTPPLNTSWKFGQDKINGVNLGGWLVLEPFISPALFQKYPGTIDEWTLSLAMTADTSDGGGIQQIEEHYKTFITEKDIAEIAGAGLNWVRVPIPFWAIDTWPGEPMLPKVAWTYFLRLVGWCRKYGLRIKLDLHTMPGSQNGYNHSGKDGSVNFLNGVMGVANAQRALNYIRILTEFISQPQYSDVIPMFGIVNEAYVKVIGKDQLTSFYLNVYNMIRGIGGIGEGKGPFISIHDGFLTPNQWGGFLTGSDRIALDTHPYFAFDGQTNSEPIAVGGFGAPDAGGKWPAQACNAWGPGIKTSQTNFGFTFAGEFSNGYNDCGLFIRGVGGSAMYGDCTLWDDISLWNDTVKAGLYAYLSGSMDALDNYFFWTWKIGNSNNSRVEAPLWSYQLGLEGGWIPKDPRTAKGSCKASFGVNFDAFSGTYSSWQTGGAGAGTIDAASIATFGQFPPATISGVSVPASQLPTYTPTGTVTTLPPPTLTPAPTKSVDVGNGWFDAQDNAGAFTTKAGCEYPDAWNAVSVTVPPIC